MIQERDAIIIDARERFAVRWEQLRDFTRKLLKREVEFTDADERQLLGDLKEHYQLSEDATRRVVTECELDVARELTDV